MSLPAVLGLGAPPPAISTEEASIVISSPPANTNAAKRRNFLGGRPKTPHRIAAEEFLRLHLSADDGEVQAAIGRKINPSVIRKARMSLRALGLSIPNRRAEVARRRRKPPKQGPQLAEEAEQRRAAMRTVIQQNPAARDPELFERAGFTLRPRVIRELRRELEIKIGETLTSRRTNARRQRAISAHAAPATPLKPKIALAVVTTPVVTTSPLGNAKGFNEDIVPVRRSRRLTAADRDHQRAELLKQLNPSTIRRLPSAMEIFAIEEAELINRLGKIDEPEQKTTIEPHTEG